MFDKIRSYFSDKNKKPEFKSDAWLNPLSGLGIPGQDKSATNIYRSCNFLSYAEMDMLYRSDGLTRRIIDIVASEMLRQGWEIEGDPQSELASQLEDMNAYHKLNTLIQSARLYGGAILIMGINDGRALDEPVNENNIKSVDWMHVFDRYQINIVCESIDKDLNSQNYGYPSEYQVNDITTGATFVVHSSRILRMDWNNVSARQRATNQGWGDSILVSIYEELKNYGSAYANLTAIVQDFINGVLKMPGLSQALGSTCTQNDILRRISNANNAKSTVNALVLDGEESYEKLSSNVAGLPDIVDRLMLALSAVCGIPITLLFGRSPAGLNATGEADVRNFYDMIKQYQELKLKPLLEKLNFYLFKARNGPTRGQVPDNWSIKFKPLWQNTEEQEANIRRSVAETDSIYIDRGVLDPNEVAISRFGGDRYSMNTQIDVEARENGYDQQEIEDLEYQKEEEIKNMQPEPNIGPDYLGNANGGNDVIIVDR